MGKEVMTNAVNLLSEGTTIVGDIKTKNDIRIDGNVKGKIITTGKLVIGNTAKIEGDIECVNIDILGEIIGNIISTGNVTLKSPAKIKGNMISKALAVEPGAVFNGSCQMGENATPFEKSEAVS
ncbi:MAG: polymer-forming cytoskeletal protein [Odoribacter sp.]|nr:polymer-forming cytoskeletal protein [Odoribacter sp.]